MNERGALSIVLHTHMPYVEGFDTWPFGEDWLWEATAAVYLPLLDLLERAGAPVTLGVTPVLADQLETLSGPPGDRLLEFLHDTREAVHRIDAEGLDEGGHPELAAEVRRSAGDYVSAARALETDRDLIGRLRRLGETTPVELMTSSATHALLPLLASDAGLRLQIGAGVAAHERRFGHFDGGFWLPECAYVPGLERELADAGVRVTCVDQTAVHGMGAPEHLEPVRTEAGVVAVPLDWQTVQLVWNGLTGYPASDCYRDYHHRTTHDLRPWNVGAMPYQPEVASDRARAHARDFVASVIERLDAHAATAGRPGLVCFALDTELLGHWWYEGQAWLEAVFGEAADQGLDLLTLDDAVQRIEPVERPLAPSTWGTAKDFSTWEGPAVADVAFAAREAELRTVAAAARGGNPGALARAARELLALQASDWAFQMTGDLSGDYPSRRLGGHRGGLDEALGALAAGDGAAIDPAVRNLAPHLDIGPLVAP